ncbi:hypothetical protein [Hymenobacter chitinivorans]|uniref:Uncharacterized protein n=1 Tax=Hymenobacter chitinivorans DSM 11115 TaxID=1121954 RepID=A0A2M9BQV5_9BACT|nr:hypothetical protein [Hymenobacter chitinivorans]PJJ60297.1 hypothetical protein CLV45_1722 [Hymenobacter chitinivorans DSM 11115]
MMRIRVLLIGVILLGTGLWLYARLMPAFVDGAVKTEADLRLKLMSESRATYYKKEAALRTNRNTLLDVGSGLAVSGLVVLLLGRVLRVDTAAELRWRPTFGKGAVLLWFNAGWGILFVALNWYYTYRAARGDYPPFADSIGIPIMQGAATLLFYWPIINGLLLLALWGAELPGVLGEMPYRYTGRAIVVEVVFGVFALLLLLETGENIVYGDHLTIPVMLGFLYLVVVLRAGHMQAVNQRLRVQA